MGENMWQMLEKMVGDGGPVMWPLAFMSLLGLSIAIRELGRFLLYRRSWDPVKIRRALESVPNGETEGVRLMIRGCDPVCRWYRKRLSDSRPHDESSVNPEDLVPAGQMALSFLATITALAPLMGILGTVLGIIQSFSALGDAAAIHEVSAGISQALVSTAAGLIVAMAALVPHNILAVLHARWDHRTTVWARRLEKALGSPERAL
jgi:biopolymer transport protein ExbB